MILLAIGSGWCQSAGPSPATPSSILSDPLAIQRPGQLSLLLFGGGYRSDESATTEEGFQLEQSLTKDIGVVARAIGYQLYMGAGFGDPLAPSEGHNARFNFGRFEGGFDFALVPGTNFYILGGGDAADSHAGVVEGDFTSWLFMRSSHPINLAMSANYDSQNRVTSSEIDLRMILYSNEQMLLIGGVGGAIFGGGFVPNVDGEGGGIVGIYFPKWQIGLDGQRRLRGSKDLRSGKPLQALPLD